ncbi:MAG: DUF72 domain-containing protein [Acidimicrobiales bacterium]|nr:DUF72 domain-containing protein [Acidimicrobiales bacterium]MCB9396017.1 DUF72 domain-containing protein [Acidimicrobiaceae bacterium]
MTAAVGCSGWTYRAWRGRFYPADLPQRRWLEHYAASFPTVESNATFYRLPRPETVESWARRVPPGFVVSVKLGSFGSHRKKLSDAPRWLPNHVDVVRRLGAHLGPTLVQLPPRWRRDTGRLDAFLATATELAPGWRWAVEVRDPSWVHDDTFAVLERHGAAWCVHDLPPKPPPVLTTSWTYVRFHGPHAEERPYTGRYGARRLGRWTERIAAWREAGVGCLAYFNNDVGGAAPLDAAWLLRRLGTAAQAPGT